MVHPCTFLVGMGIPVYLCAIFTQFQMFAFFWGGKLHQPEIPEAPRDLFVEVSISSCLQDLEDHLAAHRFHNQWLDNDMKTSNSPADITVTTPSGKGRSLFGWLVGKGLEV